MEHRIQKLSQELVNAKGEAEARKIAEQLQSAIHEHVEDITRRVPPDGHGE